MREMVWEEPPLKDPGNVVRNEEYDYFVEQLRQNPGKWAFWGVSRPGTKDTSYLKSKAPGTEWTRRIQPDRSYKVWARAIPKGECPKCGRVFQNEANLPAHVETCKGSK